MACWDLPLFKTITCAKLELLENVNLEMYYERQAIVLFLENPEPVKFTNLLGTPAEKNNGNNITALVFSATYFSPENSGDSKHINTSFDDVSLYIKINAFLQGSPVTITKSTGATRAFKCVRHKSGFGFNFTVKCGLFCYYITLCCARSKNNFGNCVHRCTCYWNDTYCSDSDSDSDSDSGEEWWVDSHV